MINGLRKDSRILGRHIFDYALIKYLPIPLYIILLIEIRWNPLFVKKIKIFIIIPKRKSRGHKDGISSSCPRGGVSPLPPIMPREHEEPQVQNPFDNAMFETIEQQIWYDRHFLIKTIILERPVIYEGFEHIGVRQNLVEQG